MGLTNLFRGAAGLSKTERNEPLHPITEMSFDDRFVKLKCAGMSDFLMPLEQTYMDLSHFGKRFVIRPCAADATVSGVQDIEVEKYLYHSWYIRCKEYVPYMKRQLPDCWGFDTQYSGSLFMNAESVYARRDGSDVLIFDRQGAHKMLDMTIDIFDTDLPDDGNWYQCRCEYCRPSECIRVVSNNIITLAEALTEERETPVREVFPGNTVVVEGETFLVEKSEDTRDGWMLWLKGKEKSRWYSKPIVQVVSNHLMLPRQYDASGNVVRKYRV